MSNSDEIYEYKFWYGNGQIQTHFFYSDFFYGDRTDGAVTYLDGAIRRLENEYNYWYSNGYLKTRAFYRNGKTINSKSWYENGQVESNNFQSNNQMICKKWNETGGLKEYSITDLNGGTSCYKHWYKNGQPYQKLSYRNGNPHGEHRQWHQDGRSRKHEFYDNETLIDSNFTEKKCRIFRRLKKCLHSNSLFYILADYIIPDLSGLINSL